VFHFHKAVPKREDRHKWTAEVDRRLVDLERAVFVAGYEKAFLLFMDCCRLCRKCAAVRAECKRPELARPSPEAMAVDVFSTVRQHGNPIEVLTDHSQAMNRYAFLLVE
jgi:predicted metal-binding protein